MTETRSSGLLNIAIIAVLLAILGIALLASMGPSLQSTVFTEHALKSHVKDVPAINNCFDGNGNVTGLYSSDYGRWAELCEDGGKHAYWRIFVCSGEDQIIISQFKQIANRTANYILNKQMLPGESAC